MSRIEITIGLLSILGVVALTALVGLGEEARMERDSRGWQARKVEAGATLYDQYCANCHGPNASGGICPSLDLTSGLHGGEHGKGIAWRLEELGWDPARPYEYIYSAIESGRAVSTRPDQYPGNKAEDPSGMAMPAWSQAYDGPLRPDQVEVIALYIAAFGDSIPEDATPRPSEEPEPTERPTRAPLVVTAAPEGTETVEAGVAGRTPAAGAPTEAAGGAPTEAAGAPTEAAEGEAPAPVATATP